MSTLRENIKEYVNALEDTDKKLKQCPKNVSAIFGKFSNSTEYLFLILHLSDSSEKLFNLSTGIYYMYIYNGPDKVIAEAATVAHYEIYENV